MKKKESSIDLSTLSTATTPFGENKMFTIREGISAEEALLYAGHLLTSACATVSAASDTLQPHDRAVVIGAGQCIESARALIDAVIDGAGVERLFSY